MEGRISRLDTELDELKNLVRPKEKSHINIPNLLKIGAKFLKNPSLLWQVADSEIKKKLQWFEFPEGVLFDGVNFRTAKVCSIFKAKELIDCSKSIIVRPHGLEPWTPEV